MNANIVKFGKILMSAMAGGGVTSILTEIPAFISSLKKKDGGSSEGNSES